ncbi:Protein HESO1 [Linum grandiflorum]
MNGPLESILREILGVIEPQRGDWLLRQRIIQELQAVVETVPSLRGATVEPFGSFVSNLFTPWGDLDITIMLNYGSFISCAGKKRKVTLLREVLRALRLKGRWWRLQFIPSAKVPILTFEKGSPAISGDISIDNLCGQMKSKCLFWLTEIDDRFRPIVLLVKEWAKANKINNPKFGTLNSYSLSLLVVFHFQTCEPAIFPPLNTIYPGNVVDDLEGVRETAEKSIADIFHANLRRFTANRSRALNRSSLSELFVSFFAKFSSMHEKAQDFGICTFTGEWQQIDGNTRWSPRTFALYVEDPFEQPSNTARTVSAGNLGKIQEAILITHRSIVSQNLGWIDLHRLLVTHEVMRPLMIRKQKASGGMQTMKHNNPNPVPRGQGGKLENQRNGTQHTHRSFTRPKQENGSKSSVPQEQEESNGNKMKQGDQLWRPKYNNHSQNEDANYNKPLIL